MRFDVLASMLVALMVFVATPATAIVSVDYTNSTGGAAVGVGDTFTVDVSVAWDGAPNLVGIFTSTMWDPGQLQLVSATNAPAQIFSGPDGSLGRLSNPRSFSGDDPGTLRTVQFGAFPSQTPSPGPSVLITRITFAVLAAGDGIAEISAFFARSDGIFDPDHVGVSTSPSNYSLGSTSVAIVPEPGTGVLIGFGLASLGRRSRRWDPSHPCQSRE